MAASRRVLLVDDNADTRAMMRMWLELDGHRVDEAGDGIDGLKAALHGGYDVALVDLKLPGLNGYEIAERIRAHSGCANLSLIALTGTALDRDQEHALEAGFDAFVLKPLSAQALAAMLLDPPLRSRNN